MTVRHLLNQTSGLPVGRGWEVLADFDDSPDVDERQARDLATLKLTRPVGSAFEYSDANYNLLGLVIEAASGLSYADYVQEHIFDPLEMNHSYFSEAPAKENGLAVGHVFWFGVPVAVPDMPRPGGSLPSGQIISCAEDMGRYMMVHLNEGRYGDQQILSPEGIAELHRPAVEAISAGISEGQYAMGWYVDEIDSTGILRHTGMVPDFFSYVTLLPEQNKGVVLLINADHFTAGFTLPEVGAGVAALLAGKEPPPIQFGFMTWLVPGLLLVPVFQVAGVANTLRLLRRWRREPHSRPGPVRTWTLNLLLPIGLNLIPISAGLAVLFTRLRGFFMLFMPDLSWLALICGGFALVWTFVRTGLVVRALRKSLPGRPD
jgi:CubicO group peptidase (beta-lactamase class C family)